MKKLKKNRSESKGFTLTEVMIAMSILTVAIVSATNLVLSLMNSNRVNVATLQAYFLAQEGLEIARNVRDTNWLQGKNWDRYNDFVLLSGTTGLGIKEIFSDQPWENNPTGTEIQLGGITFKRSLVFESFCEEEVQVDCAKLKVFSNVTWDDIGKDNKVSLSTVLTNWKKDE